VKIRIDFTSPENRIIVLLDVEDCTIIRLDKTPERDARTDGQTDGPWLLQRSALRAMRSANAR